MARSDWSRRFPPPWSVEEMNSACFIVKDNNGQALAYVYFESDAGRRTAANRSFKVHPISAPSSHERGKHYLQRFWEKLPEHGQIVVFDRSWYGRVLVERVEGFATVREWRRGYEDINQFERLLVEDGIRIVKIFLHISPGEQIRRFKDRVTNPLKRWKLSYEDFRNRERWADYEVAIEDMMEETSTKRAPWYLVPANDKLFGRLAAFKILIARLGKGVSLEPRPLDPIIAELAAQVFDLP